MVRSLSQWTKTLSFPARLSPNRSSKESVVNVQPGSPGVSPTPSASSLPQPADKTVSPIPITEISQIVSALRARNVTRSLLAPAKDGGAALAKGNVDDVSCIRSRPISTSLNCSSVRSVYNARRAAAPKRHVRTEAAVYGVQARA